MPLQPWIQPITQTPHLDKLKAALNNKKLQDADKNIIEQCLLEYDNWISSMYQWSPDITFHIDVMIECLERYKCIVETELLPQSKFLMRQKGQLKIDNSIIEEFFVRIMHEIIPKEWHVGSLRTLAGSKIVWEQKTPKLVIQEKNQDIAVGVRTKITFGEQHLETIVPVVVMECKTNLDATMFEGMLQTAASLKQLLPRTKVYGCFEYLDMNVSTIGVLDNLFSLRKAKRLGHTQRNDMSLVKEYRKQHPIKVECIHLVLDEIKRATEQNHNNDFTDGVFYHNFEEQK